MDERLFEEMQDSVISTRIRLARNVSSFPFPQKMSKSDAKAIVGAVHNALGGRYELIETEHADEIMLGALVERHLISKELLSSPHSAVLLGNDETVSVMLCEEDHIREQVILPGFALDNALNMADGIDEIIGLKVKFAYNDELGHLTACPTNLGTGMRASVMLFLPALTLSKSLDKFVKSLAGLHITIRGVYGEGSDALGCFYQISNGRTLGVSECDIIETVKHATELLLKAEYDARNNLIGCNEIKIKDEISRAYGLLRSAYTLSADELICHSAFIKLGAYYGILPVSDIPEVDELITAMQPFNLTVADESLYQNPIARDIYRARQVRNFFGDLTRL